MLSWFGGVGSATTGRLAGAKRSRCTAIRAARFPADSSASLARTPVPTNTSAEEAGRLTVWAGRTPPEGLRRRPLPAFSTDPIRAFSAAPRGFVTVYTARLIFLMGRGVIAFFVVRTGCIALRTVRGVALRTDLRTTRRANPTNASSARRLLDGATAGRAGRRLLAGADIAPTAPPRSATPAQPGRLSVRTFVVPPRCGSSCRRA